MITLEKRKQHYIPQFYLKQFCNTKVSPPLEPFVYVYDKETGATKKRGVKNIAFKNGFYDMKLITGEITPAIENFFCDVEGKSSIIQRKIIRQESLNNEDRVQFSKFVYYTLARVPNFLNFMTWFYRNSEKIIPQMEQTRDMQSSELKQNSISFPDGLSTLELMIEMCSLFAPLIYKMNWQFKIAPNAEHFVTSDNPVILNDPTSSIIQPTFTGWENPNIHLTFPLSSNMCMYATWKKKGKNYQQASKKFIRAVNFRTSFFATRYIFSSCRIEPPPINGTFIFNIYDTYNSKDNYN